MKETELIQEACRKLEGGERLELIQIVRTEGETPRGKGAFMIVSGKDTIGGTIGGGAAEHQAELDAMEYLCKKENAVQRYQLGSSENNATEKNLGMVCGGSAELEFTYLCGKDGIKILQALQEKLAGQRPTVWIFGAGHVSKETAAVLEHAGFDVIVYDNREDFASRERFPGAKKIICASFQELSQRARIAEGDYVLVMTRGHVSDYDVQKYAMTTPAGYIGVIGSRAKRAVLREKLLADGFSENQVDACHAPVGLQIGAETPEEIAISIAAELILCRAKKENRRKVREHSVIEGGI